MFEGDLSKWDVSKVVDMNNMFNGATSFNCDISVWRVSRVTDMNLMFMDATSFNQQLCGAWLYSNASKDDMFVGSPGSIAHAVTMCRGPSPERRGPSPERSEPSLENSESSLERWLAKWQIESTPLSMSLVSPVSSVMVCTSCGTFKKSGRASCCAPGGAWYQQCGGSGDKNVDHSWFDGVEACKCKNGVECYTHTLIVDRL